MMAILWREECTSVVRNAEGLTHADFTELVGSFGFEVLPGVDRHLPGCNVLGVHDRRGAVVVIAVVVGVEHRTHRLVGDLLDLLSDEGSSLGIHPGVVDDEAIVALDDRRVAEVAERAVHRPHRKVPTPIGASLLHRQATVLEEVVRPRTFDIVRIDHRRVLSRYAPRCYVPRTPAMPSAEGHSGGVATARSDAQANAIPTGSRLGVPGSTLRRRWGSVRTASRT